ncbi:hypothetical protein JCM24511_04788 [Saitozyma sp. JCM 24511]|nr:hypothetical protein JCM24511_04788 [Saitozyma sp. JCM 24511]
MVKQLEVAVVGSGSAGLSAALWLATYGIKIKVFEKRDGPLKLGHADGVQCRTVEIFESFGLAPQLLAEAHWITEVIFWSGASEQGIVREGSVSDPPPGITHQPHVVLSQGRVNGMLVEEMMKRNNQDIEYSSSVIAVDFDESKLSDHSAYPITLTVEKEGVREAYQAKYLLGCDGAHSTTRRSIGANMEGQSTEAIWGVMDTTVRTDFPDIRKKCTIRTKHGTILLIPREHSHLERFYVELPKGTKASEVTLDTVHNIARKIMHPYKMDFVDHQWWSAYSIGQRLASTLHVQNRLFLTGDACHTHSPKAGQGMNISLQDGYNIGWKLANVLSGRADPSILQSYVSERRKTAKELIDFDTAFSKMMASDVEGAVSSEEFAEGFAKSGKFTTGVSAVYDDSILTADTTGTVQTAFVNGMRFPSAQVVRFCDSVTMQLSRALPSDGKWRIIVFGGRLDNLKKVNEIGAYLESDTGPLKPYRRHGECIDAFIEPVLVMYGDRTKFEFKNVNEIYYPVTGEKKLAGKSDPSLMIYFDDDSRHDGHGHAYEAYGVDPSQGCLVIVRPDQYISAILSMDDHSMISEFFKRFLIKQENTSSR